MPTIKFTAPREIDGPPEEVLKATISQLESAAPAIHELLEQSMVQVRNAWMTFELNADEGLTPDELSDRWEASDLRKDVEHVRAAALLIRRNTGRIAKGSLRQRR
jgi:hypothetical protein